MASKTEKENQDPEIEQTTVQEEEIREVSDSGTEPFEENLNILKAMKSFQEKLLTKFTLALREEREIMRKQRTPSPEITPTPSEAGVKNTPRSLSSGSGDDNLSLHPRSRIEETPSRSSGKRLRSDEYRENRDKDLHSMVDGGSSKKSKLEENELLDVEEELFNQLDKERSKLEDEERGNKVSESLASRIPKYWKEYSDVYKTRKLIYDAYKLPSNCEINIPVINREVSRMPAFTQYYRRVDNDLKDTQYLLHKTLQILIDLADKSIKADKDSKVMNPKEVVNHVLDATVVLGHANTKLNVKRKSQLRKIFSDDTSSICNTRSNETKYLFGDDFTKLVRDAKEESTLAKSCAPKPNFSHGSNQQNTYNKNFPSSSTITRRGGYNASHYNNRRENKSQQNNSTQKPFLYQGNKNPQPPWGKNNPKFRKS